MANMLSNPKLWLTLGGLSTLPAAYVSRIIPYDVAVGTTRAGMILRLFTLIFVLGNLKSLLFGWHLRLLRGVLAHLSFRRSHTPRAPGPASLFQPLVTSTHTSLLEMDYNLHKSNSTYFADLDVARMHLVACVFARGFHRARFGREDTGAKLEEKGSPDPNGRLGIMLGGVMCQFRKELKPYVSYEIWTRVLSWDRKWVYLVSHIVRAGAVKPAGYSLQPWKKGTQASAQSNGKAVEANGSAVTKDAVVADPPVPHSAIIATSIAKYVFKRGRWTIPPEIALENSGLLPPRPDAGVLTEEQRKSLTDVHGELWDWDRMEAERQRGMKVAQHMANLDELQMEFSGENAQILGRW